jgi:hypothetical protein
VTDWELADERNDRERINRARQAAEDLFKPPQQTASPGLASLPNDTPAGPQARRQPRVFTLPPRLPPSTKAEPPPEPKPIRRKQTPRRRPDAIPSSQLGRVRALANYGMTRAQVAELYGVTIEEIDRIVEEQTYKTRSR